MVHKSVPTNLLPEVSQLGQIMVDTKLRGAGATVPHSTIPFVNPFCMQGLPIGHSHLPKIWVHW